MSLLVLLFIIHSCRRHVQKRQWEIKNKDLESSFIYCSTSRWSVFHQYDVDGISSGQSCFIHCMGAIWFSRGNFRIPRTFRLPGFKRGLLSASGSRAQTFTGDGATAVTSLVVPDYWGWELLRLLSSGCSMLHMLQKGVCVTRVCCGKVIQQPKLPFTISTFKVATLRQRKKQKLFPKREKKKRKILLFP